MTVFRNLVKVPSSDLFVSKDFADENMFLALSYQELFKKQPSVLTIDADNS